MVTRRTRIRRAAREKARNEQAARNRIYEAEAALIKTGSTAAEVKFLATAIPVGTRCHIEGDDVPRHSKTETIDEERPIEWTLKGYEREGRTWTAHFAGTQMGFTSLDNIMNGSGGPPHWAVAYRLRLGGTRTKQAEAWARVAYRLPEEVRAVQLPRRRLWIWNWIGGGYNSCKARDRAEALEKAGEISATLKVNPSTLRECTQDELDAEDRAWA